MRHFLIMLCMLAGFNGHCIAAGEQQPADTGGSTTQPADTAPGGGADKKPAEGGKKKPAEGEEEPDCE